jgi:hypothetical protein
MAVSRIAIAAGLRAFTTAGCLYAEMGGYATRVTSETVDRKPFVDTGGPR